MHISNSRWTRRVCRCREAMSEPGAPTWCQCKEPTTCLRGASFVAVVKTADFRSHGDRSSGCLSGRSTIGRVFLEREVCSASVIVPEVGCENAPKMRLVQDDHVIEACPADRADHALDIRILPGTRRRRDDFGDAHARHAAPQHVAIVAGAGVKINPDEFWRGSLHLRQR